MRRPYAGVHGTAGDPMWRAGRGTHRHRPPRV